MRDVLKVDFQEVAHVIVFAVHFQNEVDLFCCTEEAFSIILSDTGLDGIVNENLFIEGLSVLSVVLGLQADALLVELVHVEFCGHLIESKSDDFIVSLLQELLSILVSQLDEPELSQNLCIHDSEVIVNCLVEDHVVNVGVDDLTNCSDSLDAVYINILEHLIDPLWLILELVNECSQEFYQVGIVIVHTEVKTVEESHLVFLDVVGMLIDNVDDLKVQGLFLLWLLLSKSVGLFITIGNFVMEIHFFSELCEVCRSDIFIKVISEVSLDGVDFKCSFNLIDFAISIKVVFWRKTCRV